MISIDAALSYYHKWHFEAMEVTGIEGTYRATSEQVMALMRANKDSLLAVLEAFVYDPVINWRLMDGEENIIMF